MLAIGALAYSTGPDFARFMPEFYKYLEMGLHNFEEYQVCDVIVGVVGDICRALEEKVLPRCDGIMTQLLKDLSSNQLHKFVKPPIFSCFYDIALAIGENFENYLMYVMLMLQSAAELSSHISGDDDEMIEYTNLLSNGILEGLCGDEYCDWCSWRLTDTMGSNTGLLIQQSLSRKKFLNECLSSDDHLIKEFVEWAKLAISRAISVVLFQYKASSCLLQNISVNMTTTSHHETGFAIPLSCLAGASTTIRTADISSISELQDNVLDSVVTGERELRAAWVIVSVIAADPGCCLPIYRLSGRRRGQLGLPEDLKVSTFMRRYPNIFDEFHLPDTGGTLVPWFRLTPDAIRLNQESMAVFQQNQKDFLDRISKLLLLTKDTILPLHTIDQLKWDLGLPYDYLDSFISKYEHMFSLIPLPHNRLALKLISPPSELPLSQLETNAEEDDVKNGRLSFNVGFPTGIWVKSEVNEVVGGMAEAPIHIAIFRFQSFGSTDGCFREENCRSISRTFTSHD
ncbi:unnamed protein product [Lactuca virosa]|uniref:Uncharacterized protein n=1 Tax=Lactuca virosa TaxID=75947 RepID=A0AAU9MXM1_9ASTR|nr:unnamed protein product [Lactuca virosa]